ncbi:MAG TPA: pyridoxal-dependent decarboxylase [Gaiellaceae bacterium]|jgi:aromatic-L-amino-acid decarboxylase|nr:pyridoxal-dependent decarboxylase [Gaiellaceae bacterium]
MTFRDDLNLAADWVDAYLGRVGKLPVAARVELGAVRARLPESAPEHGEPFEALLRDLDELILPGLTHWNHPRFFAWFANTGSEPGILAELLIATLNVNNMTWLASPAATELEVTVLDWLAQLLGLPRGWHGQIEDTASTATVAALAAARTRKPGGVVYASEQANFSVEKAARLVGLDFRKVDVDDEYRMRADFSLDTATAVVATVGTTGTTAVDPVPELARRCAEAGVWLHVDAAYAGSAAVCPELRWCLDGVEHADSVVVNPHKWLFTPMDCSTLWTRRPEAFHEAFALVPDYLAATDAAVDLKDYGPALGRRFRALKLWAVLRWYGAEGLRALIREHVRLAQLFASLVEAEPGWEVVAPHPFSTVCFRHVEADNVELARAATATGELFVAPARLDGRDMIRLAIGNAQTTEDDIRRSWEVLRSCVIEP